MHVTGGMFKSNGTTSVPKSIPRLVVDKVKLLFSSELFLSHSILIGIKVPNKSLSQELNNVLFCSCCCCTDEITDGKHVLKYTAILYLQIFFAQSDLKKISAQSHGRQLR